MSHVATTDTIRIYPIDFSSNSTDFAFGQSLKHLQEDSELFGSASIWPSIEANLRGAMIVELNDTATNSLSYWVLLADRRLLLWKYTDRPATWFNVRDRGRACEDGMTCVNMFYSDAP